MKYPAVWLMEPGARGEILSVAFATDGMHQDAGGKVVHVAPYTSSQIISKSISKGTGRSSYRGLVKVHKGAHHVKSNVVCDALLIDEESRTDTYPYIEIEEDEVSIGHEATVSKVADEQLFYLQSRGIAEARGDEHDRHRLYRADCEGTAAGIRGRAQPADSAGDGRVRRLALAARTARATQDGSRQPPRRAPSQRGDCANAARPSSRGRR